MAGVVTVIGLPHVPTERVRQGPSRGVLGPARYRPSFEDENVVADIHHEAHVVSTSKTAHPESTIWVRVSSRRLISGSFRPAAGSSRQMTRAPLATARTDLDDMLHAERQRIRGACPGLRGKPSSLATRTNARRVCAVRPAEGAAQRDSAEQAIAGRRQKPDFYIAPNGQVTDQARNLEGAAHARPADPMRSAPADYLAQDFHRSPVAPRNPVIRLIRVVFPEPLAPTSPVIRLARISNETH